MATLLSADQRIETLLLEVFDAEGFAGDLAQIGGGSGQDRWGLEDRDLIGDDTLLVGGVVDAEYRGSAGPH